jgi:galactokinase
MKPEQLITHFSALYSLGNKQPAFFFAPGRVNLIGEHTDYNGGFVFPCAIQFGTWLMISPNGENILRFASLNKDNKAEVSLDQPFIKSGDNWINYPLGVFDQFRKRGVQVTGFDMLFYGDIPDSAGLSSSASIEMVTAFALNDLLDTGYEVLDLVKLSQKAENEFVGVNCGIMDQFAVGMGEKGYAIFLNCLTLENRLVPFKLDGFKLIISNTNKKRGLADSKYNERVAECQLAVTYLDKLFGISKLGEISYMQFYKQQDCIPDEVVRSRARHVISENQRVLNAVSCLHKGEIGQFGALMNASHESLRDNYEVTGPELDTLVEEAWKINGVIGSRMTGAGFGGCTVSIVRNDTVDRFIDEVGRNYFEKTGLKADFYIAETGEGVRRIN